MLNDEIKKKRPLLTFRTRDLGHYTEITVHEKNHKAQSLGNETLKYESEKKKSKKQNSNNKG